MSLVPHRARERFAAALLRLRQERGWSQEELAAQAKLHRNYVGSIERAERNIGVDNMEKIAEALGVSLSDMLRVGDG
ncbi:helix-turn-helix domain-containing protein [Deinococcus aquatilis]|uniref:helix-turn-helix domain-containing protein n=1 Tax=Deinococcus aquatilis TaxID=519440 RepID=UPI0003A9379C|nr:helix-turn-helix transcriptional regulator [Deinococcus aquatilis]